MPTPSELRRKAIAQAEAFVRGHLFALEERTARELAGLYHAAYTRLQAALAEAFARTQGNTWTAQDAAFRGRTESLMAQIEAEAARLENDTGAASYNASQRGYRAGYYGGGWMLAVGIRGGASVALPVLPIEAIRAAVLLPYQGSTFVDRFRDARDEFVQRVRKSIVGSQIEGEGIRQAQRRLAEELGIQITGRENRGYAARTEMIARTEILRSSNQGTMAIYEANQDVIGGWEFITAKDERVCPECGPLDGKRFPIGEGEQPPIHPNCRCSELPVLKDEALQTAIAGKRQTYSEWAQARNVSPLDDGDAFAGRGAPPSRAKLEAR